MTSWVRGDVSKILRRSLFARLVDRDVPAMRQRRPAVCDNKRIELDEAVTLLFVVAGHPRASREFVAGLRCCNELHPAADMNPGAENGVVDQNLVHDPLQQGGMAKAFAG